MRLQLLKELFHAQYGLLYLRTQHGTAAVYQQQDILLREYLLVVLHNDGVRISITLGWEARGELEHRALTEQYVKSITEGGVSTVDEEVEGSSSRSTCWLSQIPSSLERCRLPSTVRPRWYYQCRTRGYWRAAIPPITQSHCPILLLAIRHVPSIWKKPISHCIHEDKYIAQIRHKIIYLMRLDRSCDLFGMRRGSKGVQRGTCWYNIQLNIECIVHRMGALYT